MAPDDDDGLRIFRDAAAHSDLAEAIGMITAARDDGSVGHWMIVWQQRVGDDRFVVHSHYADEIVGLGLSRYVGTAIARSWEDADDDDA
jgi:hypothetical protein